MSADKQKCERLTLFETGSLAALIVACMVATAPTVAVALTPSPSNTTSLDSPEWALFHIWFATTLLAVPAGLLLMIGVRFLLIRRALGLPLVHWLFPLKGKWLRYLLVLLIPGALWSLLGWGRFLCLAALWVLYLLPVWSLSDEREPADAHLRQFSG